MTLLHISEVAQRSGVPTSTLRYYERIGLVAPSGRSSNGYREYDETTVDRLAFIGRAKRLGMTLDDVATLVDAWFAGECEPLREHLRGFVAGRIGDLRRQILEDTIFERQLGRILARLEVGAAVFGRCEPDCGCDTDSVFAGGAEMTDLVAAGPAGHAVWGSVACSLGQGEMAARVDEWQRIIGTATRTEQSPGRLRCIFDPSPEVIAELARLCAAEMACCPVFRFELTMAADVVVLTIVGPGDAADVDDLTRPFRSVGQP